jgi:Ctr copper transporter family
MAHSGHDMGDMGAMTTTAVPTAGGGHAGHATLSSTSGSAMADHSTRHAPVPIPPCPLPSSCVAGSNDVVSSSSLSLPRAAMMSPYLFADKTGFYVLFKKALVGSTGGFAGALFACFAFGILTTIGYELGKRVEQSARAAKVNGGVRALPSMLLGAAAHGFRLLLHYTAMLLVMTMNVWIIVALLLGHMVGFLVVAAQFPSKTKAGKLVGSDDGESGTGCPC